MNNYELINRMKLNAVEDKDQKFRSSIKYIVAKYIKNDIPKLIECSSLKETIVTAYKLFLSNELYNISILDKRQYIDSTDALNYFIDNYTSSYKKADLEQLKRENKILLDFIKDNNAEKMYNEYRKKVDL